MSELRPATANPVQIQPASPTSARRRYLTILFADLVGSTPICEGMEEAEDYREIRRIVEEVFEQVIPRYGGLALQIIGDE